MRASLCVCVLFVQLLQRGSGPYCYLPKMESHKEARLWNDVFVFAQQRLNIPRGTIRATTLIETILAAFEMDEIIYELREHCAGLNCRRRTVHSTRVHAAALGVARLSPSFL